MDNYIKRIKEIQKQLKKDLTQSNENNSLINMSKYNLDLIDNNMEHFRELYMEEGSKFNADKEELEENYSESYLPNVWLNQILQFILKKIFNNDIEEMKQTVITQLEMIEEDIENEKKEELGGFYVRY